MYSHNVMRREYQSFTNRPAGLRISYVTSCAEVVIGGANVPIAEASKLTLRHLTSSKEEGC